VDSISPQTVVAILTALLSAIVAISAIIITNNGHNKRLEKQQKHDSTTKNIEFLRAKIEDLYISFVDWERNFASIYVLFIPVVKGELSQKQAHEIINKDKKTTDGHLRSEMIIEMYFQHLKPDLDTVYNARRNVTKFFESSDKKDLEPFFKAQEVFEKSASELKSKIAQTSKGL
jgi:hypothetical protein